MNGMPARARPWSLSDAGFALSATTMGVVLLAWGWWESSGAAKVEDAVPGVVLGVVATVVVVGGALTWVGAGRRAVRLRRLDLIEGLEESELLAASRRSETSPTARALVAIAGSSRYHRHDCLLVRGKTVEQMPTGVRLVRRRTACEMCQP